MHFYICFHEKKDQSAKTNHRNNRNLLTEQVVHWNNNCPYYV
jgi:hypothetical protein